MENYGNIVSRLNFVEKIFRDSGNTIPTLVNLKNSPTPSLQRLNSLQYNDSGELWAVNPSGKLIKLGGGDGWAVTGTTIFTGDVVIDGGAFAFSLSNSSGASLIVGTSGGPERISLTSAGYGSLTIGASGLFVEDDTGTPRGLQYDGNYIATFTTRSLVDKGYVDAAVAAISAGWGTSGTVATLVADATLDLAAHTFEILNGPLKVSGSSAQGIRIYHSAGVQQVGAIYRGDGGEFVIQPTLATLLLYVAGGRNLQIAGLQSFANNAAAITGGLSAGMTYILGDTLGIVH